MESKIEERKSEIDALQQQIETQSSLLVMKDSNRRIKDLESYFEISRISFATEVGWSLDKVIVNVISYYLLFIIYYYSLFIIDSSNGFNT